MECWGRMLCIRPFCLKEQTRGKPDDIGQRGGDRDLPRFGKKRYAQNKQAEQEQIERPVFHSVKAKKDVPAQQEANT